MQVFLRLKKKFHNSLFFQNIAIVAGGNATAKLIGIISAPIITRLYTPEHFGVFSVFAATVAILSSISTFRYASAIPIAKDDNTLDNVIKLSFLIIFAFSLVISFVILFFGNFFAIKFSVPQISVFLWFVPIIIIGAGIYQTLNQWAIRQKKFRLITLTKVSQNASSNVIKIGIGLLGLKPFGLILGVVAQEVTGIISLFIKFIKEKPAFFKSFSIKETKAVAKRFKQFPIYQTGSQLLLNLSDQLPIFFLSSFFGAKVVGVFGLAQNMINMPLFLLVQSVSQVYFAEIASIGKNNPQKIYNLTISIIKKLFFISIGPMSLLILFGPWIFKTVFGPDWFDAGLYARYLSLIIITRFISNPLRYIFLLFEKQDIQLILNIIRLFLVIMVFILSRYMNLSPTNTILMFSIILMLYRLAIIYTALNVIKEKIKPTL